MDVLVYYDSQRFIQYKEAPSMTGYNLLSNIGGTLGLFLGMSLLSFVEIIETILQLLINKIDNFFQRDHIVYI